MGERDKIEAWLDKHNHLMELIRTVTSGLGAVFSFIVLLKIFGLLSIFGL